MSSLSNLLGDVYGDDPNPLATPAAASPEADDVSSIEQAVAATFDEPAVPEWAEAERLDRVFDEWEPGQLPEAGPTPEAVPTPEAAEVTVGPSSDPVPVAPGDEALEAQAADVAEAVAAVELVETADAGAVRAPAVRVPWQRDHDDIVPAGRARAKVNVRLPFRR